MDCCPAVRKPRGRPRRLPAYLLGDRAYGTADQIARTESRRIRRLLAERSNTAHGSGLGAFRYVVERTLACFGHFRRLKFCYERFGHHFQAFHDLAAALLTYTRSTNIELRF